MTLRIGTAGQNDAYICSEFVDLCFRGIGVNFPRHEKGFIFPEHIASDPAVKALYEVELHAVVQTEAAREEFGIG